MPIFAKICPRIFDFLKKKNFTKMNKTIKSIREGISSCENKTILDKKSSALGATPKTAIEVLPTPTKSLSDEKNYKVIRLANGLTACLISDTQFNNLNLEHEDAQNDINCKNEDESESEESTTSMESSTSESGEESSTEEMDVDSNRDKRHKSTSEQKLVAAGMCIGVGCFSDPKEIPGMAHFLEHMVFMGSEKFPRENDFDEFIKQTGGADNASTDTETTVFYFECLDTYLYEALDRFSQFFISPLMKKEAMTREREAIDSEFQIAIPSDGARKEQILFSLSKKDCPVNSFGWGNLVTLKDNVDDDTLYNGVHLFRKRHYSAHRMTLAIQARLPLEELEKYVIDCFSNVPNNGKSGDNYKEIWKDVFDTPEFNKIYYIQPVKDLCQVEITWALPSLLHKYKSKPHHFLSFLLGDEGEGSLLAYLKEKLWVIGTTIGNSESGSEHNSLFTLFTVNINLTEDGYKHLDQVIESVFSYLNMLKESGPQPRVFEEIQIISKNSFAYSKEEPAVEIVETLCEAMQLYPPEDYLTGSEIYFEYDAESIEQLLKLMTPEKINIMILKNDLETQIDYNMTEAWFGTKYAVRDIPKEWIIQWQNPTTIPDLGLPPPNQFITKDFTILPDIENNPEYPKEIYKDSLIELWYRRDLKFKRPFAYYYFYCISPYAICNAKNLCMLDTFINLLTINIAKETYPATNADLSYSFAAFEKGFTIKVWGFNENLPVLIKLIRKYLINLKGLLHKGMFDVIKDKLLKMYYNKLLKPSSVVKDVRLNLLVSNNWNPVDRYKAMLDVSFEDMQTFCAELFKSLYIKSLVQGNVSEENALLTVKEFVEFLGYNELKQEIPKFAVVRVNQGEKCCRIKNFNKDDTNSIVTNYYQSEIFTFENSIILDLIMMIIEEPLFDILRTKEQLGYHVYCSARETFGVLGYTITVNSQATKVSTQYVNERIENFLKHTQQLLYDLDEKEFNKIKNNLIKLRQCFDVDLKEEADRNWSEIISGDYIFDRIQQEIEIIKQTSLKTVRDWWDDHNLFGNKNNLRKLSIQVVGSKDKDNTKGQTPSRDEKLELVFLDPEEDSTHDKRQKDYIIKSIQEYKDSVEIFHLK